MGVMDVPGPIIVALVYISLTSLFGEPNRRNFNAIFIAGAGAAYLSGSFGVMGGRGRDHHLGSLKVRGVLEAVSDDGFVVSNDGGPSFISRSAVLQMEQNEPDA